MASSSGMDLLARAKKIREVDSIEHESIQNVPELLEKISKFLQEHETPSVNDCTHTVFDNYSDWWMNSKPTYKLAVAEDNTVDQLHRMIAQLYDLGIPLTLTEKRTTVIRFIQEIEIWGTQDECVSAAELIDCQGAFMKMLGTIMGGIYPGQPFLDVVVFDATGFSKTKGIMKTSVRLVWSNIVVDKTRAGKIHDYVVYMFKDSQDPAIKVFEERVESYSSKENQWSTIFDDTPYFGRFGIRMPLCDRVSPAPLKKPEHRPFKPLGVVRCNYKEGESQTEFESAEQLCDHTGLSGEEWIKIGCIRRDAGQELTEWQQPAFAPPASRSRPQGGGGGGDNDRGYARAEPGARQATGVRVRTQGGSGDRPQRTGPRTTQQTREESLITVQREFDGTMAEFREQLEKCMGGGQEEHFTEDAERLVWAQQNDTSRIEMKAANRRIYMTGKAHQVRSLCMLLAPFCRQVGDAASSVAGTARTAGSRGGSRAGSRPGSEAGGAHGYAPSQASGYAPSAVYAPRNYAPSEVFSVGATSQASTRQPGVQAEPSKRMTIREFAPEGSGEIVLKMNDPVTITHDPEQSEANINRWVHGSNDRSQERGWFPLSYTKPFGEESEQA